MVNQMQLILEQCQNIKQQTEKLIQETKNRIELQIDQNIQQLNKNNKVNNL